MKKLNLLLLLLTMLIFSCKEKNGEIDLAVLKERVSKSENFVNYTKIQNEMATAGILQEVSFRNLDRKMVQENISKVKTVDELKALYAKAGMTGGDKLATLQFALDKSLKDLTKEIPELKRLSRSELADIMANESDLNKKEIEDVLNKNN